MQLFHFNGVTSTGKCQLGRTYSGISNGMRQLGSMYWGISIEILAFGMKTFEKSIATGGATSPQKGGSSFCLANLWKPSKNQWNTISIIKTQPNHWKINGRKRFPVESRWKIHENGWQVTPTRWNSFEKSMKVGANPMAIIDIQKEILENQWKLSNFRENHRKIDENRWQVLPRGGDYPFQPASNGLRRGGGRG